MLSKHISPNMSLSNSVPSDPDMVKSNINTLFFLNTDNTLLIDISSCVTPSGKSDAVTLAPLRDLLDIDKFAGSKFGCP